MRPTTGRAAHFGELSATSLASRGCAGAVLDGGARDAEYILREDFPVFSRYVTPQDCVLRWELMAHGDVTIVVGGVGCRRATGSPATATGS